MSAKDASPLWTIANSSAKPTDYHKSEPEVSSLVETVLKEVELVQGMFSQVFNGYLTSLCVVSGIFLNVLCIYIFLRFRYGSQHPAIQYYLVTLAAWQTALLCNAFFLYCLPTLIYGYITPKGNYVFIYPYVYALANATHTGSVWIILALTIDRYLALCKPIQHRTIGKRSRVKRLMFAVSILAILFSLPRFFEVTTVYECPTDGMEKCIPRVSRTSLPMNRTYWTIYHIILGMLFVTLVPCLILLGLTLRISLALRKAIIKRKELCPPEKDLDGRNKKGSSKKEHQANIMLVLVIVKFLISDIFPTVADVAEHMVGYETFMSSRIATLFVDISNFLVVLNCSTNFWIFLFWGKRFRRGCRYTFAVSPIGRALHHCTRTHDSEYVSNGYHRPSLFTTNYPSSRVCCCSDRKISANLRPCFFYVARMIAKDPTSTTVMVVSENGYLQEPLLKNYSAYTDFSGRVMRARSYSGCICGGIRKNSGLEDEQQQILKILAAQRR